MNELAVFVLCACCLGIFFLGRRSAVFFLLACACAIPLEPSFVVGPFNFPPLRVALAVAMLRVLCRAEGLAGGVNRLDRAMFLWAAVALITSLGHEDVAAVLVNRLGLVFTGCGTYVVLRILCRSLEDVEHLCRIVVWLLVPVAAAMLLEASTGRNLFSYLGAVNEFSEVRDGRLRSQGPFAHSILAGSVGAACLPLAAGFWATRRRTALVGIAACLAIVFTSSSSGPVMGALAGLLGLAMWKYRRQLKAVRWLLVVGYVGLEVVMNAPAYFVLTRIDFTGSSTSWHRAALIETAIAHLPEWWLAGTDRTRHWLAYGVGWSSSHADITNYYLRMGVDGGLPLLLAFVLVLTRGFSMVGQSWRTREAATPPQEATFLPWALGASLLAHASSFVGVSYFDQSVVFLYLTLAGIATTVVPATALPAISNPLFTRQAYSPGVGP